MAEDFRRAGVQAIVDFGFTKFLLPEEARALHDYGFATHRAHPDAVLGQWVHFQPEVGAPALAEFRRCLDVAAADRSFVGLAVMGSGGLPASDAAWDPFYRLCVEARAPVLVFVGTTGLGAGLPGGMGITLDSCHPRHLDAVAARFADLTIVAARPAWPWQSEMIAILLHKPQRLVRTARLVAEILHRGIETGDPAPPLRAGHVRRRLPALFLRPAVRRLARARLF